MNDTRQRILDAGLKLWPNVTLQSIADAIGLTHPAILYYFPGRVALRKEIIKHALATNHSRVIVQLIAEKHPAIRSMSAADRIRHFNAI